VEGGSRRVGRLQAAARYGRQQRRGRQVTRKSSGKKLGKEEEEKKASHGPILVKLSVLTYSVSSRTYLIPRHFVALDRS
jgi:hypothetical protein